MVDKLNTLTSALLFIRAVTPWLEGGMDGGLEGGLVEVERVGRGTARTGGAEAHVAAECGWAVGLEEGDCTSLPSCGYVRATNLYYYYYYYYFMW